MLGCGGEVEGFLDMYVTRITFPRATPGPLGLDGEGWYTGSMLKLV